MRRVASAALAAWASLALAVPASAGVVLDRVRATGTIRCGGVERPGLLDVETGPSGLLADLCRAIGVAVLGPAARVEVRAYDSDLAFAAAPASDDVMFVSGAEIVDQHLAGRVLPGPPVYFEETGVMVAGASPARTLADLAGQSICFEQGTGAHRALEAWAAARHVSILRMGYQEPDEMHDAFDAQACHGIAGEATTLAFIRRHGGPVSRSARILAEPLARFPIVAATSLDDATWSALVNWSIDSLVAADQPDIPWRSQGLASLPLGPVAGLPPDWQAQMVAATGSYAAMRDHDLGTGSWLGLPVGANIGTDQGGLLAAPSAN